MREIHALNKVSPLHVPGNFPYRERRPRSKTSPITREELCKKCKGCASVCPTAAITVEDKIITNQDVCILCCACVKSCPQKARVMDDPHIRQTAERLNIIVVGGKSPKSIYNGTSLV
jgi:ferredoxin